ncbi:MAG: hypothetical protein HZB76_07325 [Chlamydiae bacterium]|nr:hypothetical protein [Chlamydiota bacterium]
MAAAAASTSAITDRFLQTCLNAEKMENEDCRNTGRCPNVALRTLNMLRSNWRIETDDSLQPEGSYLKNVYLGTAK